MKKCQNFDKRTKEYKEQGLCDHNNCTYYYEGICCIPAEEYEKFEKDE